MKAIEYIRSKLSNARTYKKFGVIGITFFLLKGIAWLVLTYLIIK